MTYRWRLHILITENQRFFTYYKFEHNNEKQSGKKLLNEFFVCSLIDEKKFMLYQMLSSRNSWQFSLYLTSDYLYDWIRFLWGCGSSSCLSQCCLQRLRGISSIYLQKVKLHCHNVISSYYPWRYLLDYVHTCTTENWKLKSLNLPPLTKDPMLL